MPEAIQPRSVLFLALLAFVAGCNPCDYFESEPTPWRYTDDEARYEVIFPPEWTSQPAHTVNPHADMVAVRDEMMFFMVIPQELPSFPEPDVFELTDIALETLDETVDDLVVDRRSSLELDGAPGLAVFASGTVDDQPVHYITVYVIREDTGYQIAGFTDGENRSGLFDEMDAILSQWSFRDGSDAEDVESTDLQRVADEHGPLESSGEASELEEQ